MRGVPSVAPGFPAAQERRAWGGSGPGAPSLPPGAPVRNGLLPRVSAPPPAAVLLGALWLCLPMAAAAADCYRAIPLGWGPDPKGVCQGDSYEITSEPSYLPPGCTLDLNRSIDYLRTGYDPSDTVWDSARGVFTATAIGERNCNCPRTCRQIGDCWQEGPWSEPVTPEQVCLGDVVPKQTREVTPKPPGCRGPEPPNKPSHESAATVTGTHPCQDTRPRLLSRNDDWCKFGAQTQDDYRVALLFSEPAANAATATEPCRIMRQRYNNRSELIYLMWLHDDPAGDDYDRGRGGFPLNLEYRGRFEYWRDLLRDGGYGDWCVFNAEACAGVPPNTAAPNCSLDYYPNPLPACASPPERIYPQPRRASPTSVPTNGACGTAQHTCADGLPRKHPSDHPDKWQCAGIDGGIEVECGP